MDTINKIPRLLRERHSMIAFTLLTALLLGVFCPDFRYDLLSIFVIQVARPIVFAVPMIVALLRGRTDFRLCVGVGLGGLVLCQLVALAIVTLETSNIVFCDRLSIPIAIGSFAVQVIVFTLVVFFLWLLGWHLARHRSM